MCNSCSALNINGLLCHETGCPESWKNEKRNCQNCGSEFVPQERMQSFCCDDCWNDYNGYYDNIDYYCDNCGKVIEQKDYNDGQGLCFRCIDAMQ